MRRSSIFETILGFSLLWTLAGCSDSVVRPDPRDVATLGVANSAPLAEATPRDLEIIGGSANGINDAGAVAGHVVTTSQIRAFVWTPQEGMQELIVGPGNAHATDIDNGGMVVGCTDEPRAFIWSAGAGFRDLGTLGGSYACALGMNNKGDVVGYSFTETGAMRAFIWSATRGMRDLGALAEGASSAHDVNEKGEVVGYSEMTPGEHHAFLWTEAEGMRDLGTLGGSMSFAYGINDRGQIAGFAQTPEGPFHAVLWTPGADIRDLGTLGGSESAAQDINERGEITGYSRIAGDSHDRAFLWTEADGMRELRGLGDNLHGAGLAINKRGQVAGYSQPAENENRATVWDR